jgi:hypothetical protein
VENDAKQGLEKATIEEENVFRIISLWGQRMKFPLASFNFSVSSSFG